MSDGQPTAQLHTEAEAQRDTHVWQAAGSNEVSGNLYARDTDKTQPAKLGEIPGLVEQLKDELGRLDKDASVLEEKLGFALASKLPPVPEPANTASSGSTESMPHTVLGRSLRDAIARVMSVRLHVQDLTERAGL